MAAYFTFSESSIQFGELHINCPRTISNNLKTLCHICIEVQVDGNELISALSIVGRQSVPRKIFTFVGDEAKTICAN